MSSLATSHFIDPTKLQIGVGCGSGRARKNSFHLLWVESNRQPSVFERALGRGVPRELPQRPQRQVPRGPGFEPHPELSAGLLEDRVQGRQLAQVDGGEEVVQGVIPERRGHQEEAGALSDDVTGCVDLKYDVTLIGLSLNGKDLNSVHLR